MKPYKLGLVLGRFYVYWNAKTILDEVEMREIYSRIGGDDDSVKMLKALIELDNKNTLTVEKITEVLENNKSPEEQLTDNDREFLEDFMEFLNQKKR